MDLGTPETTPDRWETVLDAVEQAFTVALPRGWQNRAWLVRSGPAVVQAATSTHPDGATVLFTGDPEIPLFVEPGSFGMAGAVTRPGTSVEHFLPMWAGIRFGRAEGFRIVGMEPWPPLFELVVGRARASGTPIAWATAGRLRFAFRHQGREVSGVALGSTLSLGAVWTASVHGITGPEIPYGIDASLLAVVRTGVATPAAQRRVMDERAASAAQHRATMAMIDQNTAILQSNHRQNMANLHTSAASHQQHMAAIHASHDAHNQAWSAQQAGIDARHTAAMHTPDDGHRRFLNTITEQRTVVDGQGNTFQVADGYDRYFYRASDQTWIGLRSHEDLSSVRGIDPNDFEEMKIKHR